jgi:uncharacterized protein YaeQ
VLLSGQLINLGLTVAQHPSENIERMMTRVLVYCLNAQEYLVFTKGLSSVAEPDIWARTLDDQISLWIDIGEPAVDRIKKATRLAAKVKVYSFNSKSSVWWAQEQAKFSQLQVSVYRLQWESIQSLVKLAQRSMDFSVTITADLAYIATAAGECEVLLETLQLAE